MQVDILTNDTASGSFVSTIQQFLDDYFYGGHIPPLVIAFSGGVDSMALLHSLTVLRKKRGIKIYAAHLNHGWRGEFSDNDEANCRNFCKNFDIEFYSEKLSDNVQKTETAARDARYKFFERAAKYFGTNVILTAHTKSDNAETVLYRIAKGTGIKGLCGISEERPLSDIICLRPMLALSREHIEQYCSANQLSPNIDLSNFDVKYNRNFIRHKLIPLLDKINEKSCEAIDNLSRLAVENEAIVKEYLDKVRADIFKDEKICTAKFASLSAPVKNRLIYDYIQTLRLENDFDYSSKKVKDLIEFIEQNMTSKSGRTLSLAENLWLFVSSKYIYTITEKCNLSKNIELLLDGSCGRFDFGGINFTIQECGHNPEQFPKETENYAYVFVKDFAGMAVRYRKPGDVIRPFGMKHTIKLKDYFINKGIPQHKKDKIVLLCKDNEVMWASGVGLNEKLRVTAKPSHILRIDEVENDN